MSASLGVCLGFISARKTADFQDAVGRVKVDVESVPVGLELICARCAAGLAVAFGLLWGCGWASFGLFWEWLWDNDPNHKN